MFNESATISDVRVQLESLDKSINQLGGSSYIESSVDIGNDGKGFIGYYGIFDDKVADALERDPRVEVYEDVKVTLPAWGRSKNLMKMASKYSGEQDVDFSAYNNMTVSSPSSKDTTIDFERLKSMYDRDTHDDMDSYLDSELEVSQMQFRRQRQRQRQKQQQQQKQKSQQATIPAHMLATEKTTQWGLHRLSSQKNSLTSGVARIVKPYEFMIPRFDTVAYVIDSGIRISHKDFDGRAVWGYNAIDHINQDLNGHGSHVAGTIGANKWGVSKRTLLVAVKAFGEEDCVSVGTYLHAVNWAINDYISKGHDRAVINMSVGVPRGFEPFDRLVRHAIMVGMPVAIAAGNDGRDACNYSPSRMGNFPGAVTAAASNKDDRLVRRFAGWMSRGSNYGECVTVFAPGMNIESVSHLSDTGTDIMSGTSMAAPHVAGLMAYFQSISDQLLTPNQMEYLITHGNQGSMKGRLKMSPNRLIYNGL